MTYIRVLLVDDDYLVLQDLKSIIHWESLGYKVVATARNGKSAMDAYKRFTPQVIICDISMPVMDGLDFIEQVRQIDPDVFLVVLSSHENFSYAQRAIKSGIYDYLLKSDISKESVTSKLLEISKELDSLQYKLERVIRIFFSDFFSSNNDNGFVMPAKLDEASINLFQKILHKEYWFMVISPHLSFDLAEEHFRGLEKCGRDLFQILRDSFYDRIAYPVMCYVQNFIILGSTHGKAGIKYKADYQGFMQKVFRQTKSNLDTGLMVAGTSRPITPEGFRRLFHKWHSHLVFNSFFPPRDMLWLGGEEGEKPIDIQIDYSLIDADIKHQEPFFEQLETITRHLTSNRDGYGFLKLFNDIIPRYRQISTNAFTIDLPVRLDTPQSYMAYLKHLYTGCLDGRHSHSLPLKMALTYIQARYGDSRLGIEEIAKHAGLSASRLSVLFKKEVGTTINDYITDWRIGQAIRLLKDTNLKVYEVAGRVGYQSAQYFSQVLQKHTGKRPLDYRRPDK